MQFYTFSHVLQVFILGFIGGFFIGGLLVSSIRFKKVTDRRIVIRPTKRKIPSVSTTEYPIVSYKNY
ncbi:hypothetical protein [Clostridium sp. BNL1100]|uniref:hypothetical protein n=1 Tax=Clostridium sp. BNL1100 TaxID=755731 RepID=UPI00024A77EE|nr:hypothetical protein [Clostridium sp. BNL1100]AEY65651.1 hypothetical protein Clo1100_1416 [Clostridium sp. BNL1100]